MTRFSNATLCGATAIAASLVGTACINHGDPAVVPPNDSVLTYREHWPLSWAQGSNYLYVRVPVHIKFKTTKDGDCGHSYLDSLPISIKEADDYFDFTLTDETGVAPGAANARAYVLTRTGGPPNSSDSWTDLRMEQADTAAERLQVVRWRMVLNPNPPVPGPEIGAGGPVAPPRGQSPWQRLAQPGAVGGLYTLTALTGVEADHLSATLVFRLTVGRVKICR